MWDRNWLEALGFQGWVRLLTLDTSTVPGAKGVYVVYRAATDAPVFKPMGPVLMHKTQALSYSVEALEDRWVTGAHVLNIGKADAEKGLRGRLGKYSEFGQGRPVAHRGGRSVWQLADAAGLLIAWLPTPLGDPEDVEGELIDAFGAFYGRPPFANVRGRRREVRSTWRLLPE